MKTFIAILKLKLISLLRKLASNLEGDSVPAELLLARKLVAEAELLLETSGEYKRHVVYSKLLKEFPHLPKRYLGLLIEKALN